MSLYDKELCAGPSGCGHPRHTHDGTHLKGSKTACRRPLGQGRATCSCGEFRGIHDSSSDSKRKAEGVATR